MSIGAQIVLWVVIGCIAPFVLMLLLVLITEFIDRVFFRRANRHRDLLARCEKQHQWVLKDDPRGIYGVNPYQSLEDQVLEWQTHNGGIPQEKCGGTLMNDIQRVPYYRMDCDCDWYAESDNSFQYVKRAFDEHQLRGCVSPETPEKLIRYCNEGGMQHQWLHRPGGGVKCAKCGIVLQSSRPVSS